MRGTGLSPQPAADHIDSLADIGWGTGDDVHQAHSYRRRAVETIWPSRQRSATAISPAPWRATGGPSEGIPTAPAAETTSAESASVSRSRRIHRGELDS